MPAAKINQLIELVDGALQALKAEATMANAETIAMVIHHAMESRTRAYHTADHIFGMCGGMNPHQTLAALFHDLVYFQLDGGFPKLAAGLLKDVVQIKDSAVLLRAVQPADQGLALCHSVFGFAPGQTLNLYGGMNEFLSAVVAVRTLQEFVPPAQLIPIVACIEATIPFRAVNAKGLSAAQALAQRLTQHVSVEQAARMVKDAVTLANRDVGGFGLPGRNHFLSNTWLLIEESNAPLQAVGIYSLKEYRVALMRMSTFLSGLNPASIFQSFAGTPDAATLENLCANASRNIGFAIEFLQAKTLSAAIVEALALCTGADCPVSMFLGDIANPAGKPIRAEHYLPQAPEAAALNRELLEAFQKGRSQAASYDLTVSPLTAFIYQHLGSEGTRAGFSAVQRMSGGDLTPLEFLQQLKPPMVRALINACSQIAVSRQTALRTLKQKFHD